MSEERKVNTALPFILVSDNTLINLLQNNGYVCVYKTKSIHTFMNNGKLTFSESLINSNKIIYSNKLCI